MLNSRDDKRASNLVNKTPNYEGFGMIPRWFVFDKVHNFKQIALFAYMTSRRSSHSRVWVQLERLSNALLITPNTARAMLKEACTGDGAWLQRETTQRGDPRGTVYRFLVGRTGKPERTDREHIKQLQKEIKEIIGNRQFILEYTISHKLFRSLFLCRFFSCWFLFLFLDRF